MFAAALAAPIAIFQLDPLGKTRAPHDDDRAFPPKLIATESRDAAARLSIRTPARPLIEVLGDGPIMPGVGIGGILLDADIRNILRDIREPSTLHYDITRDGMRGQHRVSGDDISVTLTTDPTRDAIDAVTLAAEDCEAVRRQEVGAETLPSTDDGISLGSHASRTEGTFGTVRAATHGAPGIRLTYCPENSMVGKIRIERLPPAPLLADRGGPAAILKAPTLAQMVRDERFAQAPASADDTVPRGHAPAVAAIMPVQPRPDVLAALQQGNIPANVNMDGASIASPQPLLALNGGGFAIADALSLSPESMRSTLAVRSATPPQFLMRTAGFGTNPGTDPDAQMAAEFEGLGDVIMARGMSDEEGLKLSRGARGEVQTRLALLGYDPGGADGVFGPRTREVIAALQADEALPTTGHLDPALLRVIETRSDRAYARWEARIRTARARKAASDQFAAKLPPARNAPQCARDTGGRIIQNQSISCDLTVLSESLSKLGSLFSGSS